jgi:hypothetical protein
VLKGLGSPSGRTLRLPSLLQTKSLLTRMGPDTY